MTEKQYEPTFIDGYIVEDTENDGYTVEKTENDGYTHDPDEFPKHSCSEPIYSSDINPQFFVDDVNPMEDTFK